MPGDLLVAPRSRSPTPRGRQRRRRRIGGGGDRRPAVRATPISPRCSSATASASTRPAPTPSPSGAPRRSAHGPRERRRPRRRRLLRRVRPARDRRPAPPPRARRPDRQHAGRRARRRHRHRQRRRVRADAPRCVVMSYDYTVLAGTQGLQNHRKKDRLFELAERLRLPVVFFTEGGGGRPGDTDGTGVVRPRLPGVPAASPSCRGLVPLVGINAGLCFAGNAAHPRLLRRRHRHRGLEHRHGRPGDDRGRRPRRVRADGDRADRRCRRQRRRRHRGAPTRPRRVAVAKQYLSYFQGPVGRVGVRRPDAAARRRPREPAAQLRRAHASIDAAVRHRLGARAAAATSASGMVTALARVEGRPVGVDRQQPDAPRRRDRRRRRRQGGAVHAAVRRVRPPGRLPVRHAGDHGRARGRGDRRSCATAAGCSSPAPTSRCRSCTIVLRKGYGLGAQAMAGGSFKAPLFVRRVADRRVRRHGPRGRGAARLPQGARGRSTTPTSARRCSSEMVDRMYEHGKALNVASLLRDRRRHRPGRLPPLDHRRPRRRAAAAAPRPARSAPTSTPGDGRYASRRYVSVGGAGGGGSPLARRTRRPCSPRRSDWVRRSWP